MTPANEYQIAATIQRQIGHGAFVMMGAKNLAAGRDSLSWKVGRNAKKVTHITVTLLPSDTYKITFYNVRGSKVRVVSEAEGVYVDNLHTVIESGTGLYLSL